MRTTIVSTSKLAVYKTILVSTMIISIIGLSTYFIWQRSFVAVALFLNYGVMIYLSARHIKKIRSISYDQSSIYYVKNDYEVQVPFENIKSIEIVSIDGVYAINFYHPVQDGEKIFFKTSLWYPFNFQKKDDEVNILRDRIDRYKRTLPEKNFAGLPSFRI